MTLNSMHTLPRHFWVMLAVLCSCDALQPGTENPFVDGPLIRPDGVRRSLTAEIVRLGDHAKDTELSFLIESASDGVAYILRPYERAEDGSVVRAGVIIDGGPINETFYHRVREPSPLFLAVYGPAADNSTIVVDHSPADFRRRPSVQSVELFFEPSFLSSALFREGEDPPDFRDFLEEIEGDVRVGILCRVREIFQNGRGGYRESGSRNGLPPPVYILCENEVHCCAEGISRPPCSKITFTPSPPPPDGLDGVVFEVEEGTEGGDPCEQKVIFGAVDRRSACPIDAGNRCPDDSATVYTRSFRGALGCDQGLALNSVQNLINALATCAAHEIGHLIGLQHTALDGIMVATPTRSVQRQLWFQPSQIVRPFSISTSTEIIETRVFQDPCLYLDHVFETSFMDRCHTDPMDLLCDVGAFTCEPDAECVTSPTERK